ncbi:probable leucine--tRNA ligase, mitochondrial isoform X2 [Eriocheir sinensis]|uniref:probable leucine--tRNA ligase, mitochondrial isoform X2 n=1 Tax=Eriocheir sinensis TaxID=95602 RepID=UPI0021C70782|nr:probable leucine--tRNA ligase, mitochondrial isoform X2 [Eriocheir sinensis]
MERLRSACRLLSQGRRQGLGGHGPRLIYSKTGVWPVTNDELSHSTKKDVDEFWKDKYRSPCQKLSQDDGGGLGKKYVLSMFPYPSGKLHLGHVRVYATGDAMARFYCHRGYKVIHPIGWDAFGLPAENAAIDSGEMPDRWTYANIQQMKEQLLELGCSFEWQREFATCDPEYYKWTQWLFLRLFQAGLAYQEEALVNWDPVDQTVLANEQVDEQGCSWRSGAKVERRFLRQWFIKTTRFSKSLLDGLSDPMLENWRDITKIQRHWIGDCGGYRVEVSVVGEEQDTRARETQEMEGEGDNTHKEGQGVPSIARLDLWMAQPELLHGIAFIGVRSGHALDAEAHRRCCRAGHQLLTVSAVCPISQRKIPVITSDSLPYAEDADIYVGIPCVSKLDADISRECGFTVPHVLENDKLVNSGELSGLRPEEARQQVAQRLLEARAGGFETSAKLKDWLISRQRYWGTPIPIIHCPSCGAVPVPEDQLPVELPSITHFPKRGISPLKEAQEWLRCPCPKCGQESERETDTMDTFVDSSWYFLRFLDPQNSRQPFHHDLQDTLMPVDLYIGGKEHAVLHMLFARFMQHFLASEGLVSHWEPFRRLVMMGMVMGTAYRVKDTGRYLTTNQVDFSVEPPVELGTGAPLVITTEKMSKSKHNGVDPQEVLEKYGTDTTRLLMLANFAPASARSWSEETFPGIFSWQNRLWMTVAEFIEARQGIKDSIGTISAEEREEHEQHLWHARNHSLSNITYVMEHTHQLNAAISFMQALTISLRKVPMITMLSEEFERTLAAQIIMLSPLTPHFASELWAGFSSVAACPSIKKELPLTEQPWPEVDQDYPLPLRYSIPGEEPQQVKVPRRELDTLTPARALQLVSAEEGFQQHLQGRTVLETYLKILPGLRASVSFTYSVHDLARAKEALKKKKEEKKKQKLEKRLKRKQGTIK